MKRWMVSLLVAIPAALATTVVASAKGGKPDAAARRGEYLVTVGGCHDCHSPKNMGPSGPEPDLTRALSGHPEGESITSVPKLGSGPWAYEVSPGLTAWAGPWGVSFAANLTPDPETGLGKWKAENFIEAMRTGRHMGRGRPILPPMPYFNYAKMTDADLRAVFAYLHTLKPIRNRVPDPLPPESAATAGSGAPATTGGTGTSGK
jgi:mono/diheme cytochrome c family protein